jgi:hypothetical protein
MYYAIDLAWPVFPLLLNSKKPATEHGFRDATTDPAQIARWWRASPRSGVGIACSSVVVLDIDTKPGKVGRESLARICETFGELPETWTAETATGGLHFYFATPLGATVRRRCPVRADFPDVDLCGLGGYIVAPPTTVDGRAYRWTNEDVGLAPCPEWLATLGAVELPKPSGPRDPKGSRPEPKLPRPTRGRWGDDVEARARRALAYVERCDPAIAGAGGHNTTFRVVLAVVRGFDLPRAIAREILAYYSSRCVPPWSARELDHKLDSAARSHLAPGYLLDRSAA